MKQLELASAGGEKEAGEAESEPEEPLRVPSLVHRNGYLLETVYKPEAHGFLS